jgi:hypothetical protein
MVYIVETLQTANGEFMANTFKPETHASIEVARLYAQEQSNIYGTITRVSPFPVPKGYSWGVRDYFYPVII